VGLRLSTSVTFLHQRVEPTAPAGLRYAPGHAGHLSSSRDPLSAPACDDAGRGAGGVAGVPRLDVARGVRACAAANGVHDGAAAAVRLVPVAAGLRLYSDFRDVRRGRAAAVPARDRSAVRPYVFEPRGSGGQIVVK